MSETTNEPPAGQTWDETLRQWTPSPSASAPELVCYISWIADNALTNEWQGRDTGSNNFVGLYDGPALNNLVVLNDDFIPGYDTEYNDFGLRISRRGILRIEVSGTVKGVSGSADLSGRVKAQVYGYTIGFAEGGGALIAQGAQVITTANSAAGSAFTSMVADPSFQGQTADGRNFFLGAFLQLEAASAVAMYCKTFNCNVTFQPL